MGPAYDGGPSPLVGEVRHGVAVRRHHAAASGPSHSNTRRPSA
jgi:hypothetical protein